MVFLAALILTHPTAADSDDAAIAIRRAEREAAVVRAREGDAAGALRQLVALRNRNPDDLRLRIDTGVIASWAGEDATALELLGSLPLAELPDYALSALAKAARNAGSWDVAVVGYGVLIDRDASELDHHLGRIFTLADAGRIDEARRELDTAATRFVGPAESSVALALGCGYLEERARRFTQALGCYNRALALEPGNREAKRRRIIVASALGAAEAALSEARATPGLLSADALLRLEIDAVAMRIRWSNLPTAARHGQRDAEYLTRLSELAVENPELLTDLDNPNGRAYQFDRVVAFVADYRMREAIALFEALEQSPALMGNVPAYAYGAVGQAYLFDEQPEHAKRCFRAALAQRPDLFKARVGLFYALSDQHRTGEARDVAERLLADEPAWLRPNERIWRENRRYAEVRQIAAMEQAYRERYGSALESLDEMLAIAPANASVRVARAQVLSWRGWYERAATELALAEFADPGNPRTAVVSANVALDSQRFGDAEASLGTALTAAPQEKATQRLEERWRLHNSPEIVLRAEAARSDGSAFSSESWRADGYYFSSSIAYHYRAYLHDVVRHAEFDEGIGRDHRLGAGVEYRGHHFTARGEVYQGFEQNDDTGASASLDWHLGDRIIVEASVAANSVDVPLRAVRVGISGDTLGTAATYRWHEGRALTARASFGSFDDGNRRRAVGADYRWRAFNAPRHKLLANISAYASRNSEPDRPYFNPARDRAFTVGLTHEWRIHRRYDQGLIQRLGVEAGEYWQKGFGGGSVWTVRLEHAWSLGPRWELSYGASTGVRLYDGDREHQNAVFLSVQGRL